MSNINDFANSMNKFFFNQYCKNYDKKIKNVYVF